MATVKRHAHNPTNDLIHVTDDDLHIDAWYVPLDAKQIVRPTPTVAHYAECDGGQCEMVDAEHPDKDQKTYTLVNMFTAILTSFFTGILLTCTTLWVVGG